MAYTNDTKPTLSTEFVMTEALDFLMTEDNDYIITNQSNSWSNDRK